MKFVLSLGLLALLIAVGTFVATVVYVQEPSIVAFWTYISFMIVGLLAAFVGTLVMKSPSIVGSQVALYGTVLALLGALAMLVHQYGVFWMVAASFLVTLFFIMSLVYKAFPDAYRENHAIMCGSVTLALAGLAHALSILGGGNLGLMYEIGGIYLFAALAVAVMAQPSLRQRKSTPSLETTGPGISSPWP